MLSRFLTANFQVLNRAKIKCRQFLRHFKNKRTDFHTEFQEFKKESPKMLWFHFFVVSPEQRRYDWCTWARILSCSVINPPVRLFVMLWPGDQTSIKSFQLTAAIHGRDLTEKSSWKFSFSRGKNITIHDHDSCSDIDTNKALTGWPQQQQSEHKKIFWLNFTSYFYKKLLACWSSQMNIMENIPL